MDRSDRSDLDNLSETPEQLELFTRKVLDKIKESGKLFDLEVGEAKLLADGTIRVSLKLQPPPEYVQLSFTFSDRKCKECHGPLDEYDNEFCSMLCVLNWDAAEHRLPRYALYDSFVVEKIGSGSL